MTVSEDPRLQREEVRFLRAVLDSLNCPFYVVNARTYRIRLASTNLTSNDSAETGCYSLLNSGERPTDAHQFLDPIDQVRLTGRPAVMEHVHYEASGRPRYTEVHSHPIYDSAGQVTEVVQYAFDVTPRKEVEIALKQERDLTVAILDTTTALVVLLDAKGRIVRFNRACESLTGWTASEVHGKEIWEALLPAEEAEIVRDVFHELVSDEYPSTFENHWVTKDNGHRLIEWSNTVLRDEQGAVRYVIGTGLDITDRRQDEQRIRALNEHLESRVAERTAELEQRAEQTRRLTLELAQTEHRERRKLAQILHDDVQQLLVGARLGVATLGAQSNDPNVQAELDQIDQILNSLIATTRSLAVELGPPVLQLAGLAAALRWLAQKITQRHGLPVNVAVDGNIQPEQEEVASFLFQAVRELLFNVVKHARADGAAVTASLLDHDQLRIAVADSGVGFRIDHIEAANSSNEGFGLFNIRDRLHLMGGQLVLESEPGAGTCVTMIVPRHVV